MNSAGAGDDPIGNQETWSMRWLLEISVLKDILSVARETGTEN